MILWYGDCTEMCAIHDTHFSIKLPEFIVIVVDRCRCFGSFFSPPSRANLMCYDDHWPAASKNKTNGVRFCQQQTINSNYITTIFNAITAYWPLPMQQIDSMQRLQIRRLNCKLDVCVCVRSRLHLSANTFRHFDRWSGRQLKRFLVGIILPFNSFVSPPKLMAKIDHLHHHHHHPFIGRNHAYEKKKTYSTVLRKHRLHTEKPDIFFSLSLQSHYHFGSIIMHRNKCPKTATKGRLKKARNTSRHCFETRRTATILWCTWYTCLWLWYWKMQLWLCYGSFVDFFLSFGSLRYKMCVKCFTAFSFSV